jgi:hypothetical protein
MGGTPCRPSQDVPRRQTPSAARAWSIGVACSTPGIVRHKSSLHRDVRSSARRRPYRRNVQRRSPRPSGRRRFLRKQRHQRPSGSCHPVPSLMLGVSPDRVSPNRNRTNHTALATTSVRSSSGGNPLVNSSTLASSRSRIVAASREQECDSTASIRSIPNCSPSAVIASEIPSV